MQASPDWTARTALVTGAGGAGVGGATARRLAAEGVSIVALDNHAERLREACAALRSEYGVAVHEAHVDLRDRGELDRSLAESQDALGPIDTLVNNAAISIQGSIFDQSPEVFDDVLDVDLAASRASRPTWPGQNCGRSPRAPRGRQKRSGRHSNRHGRERNNVAKTGDGEQLGTAEGAIMSRAIHSKFAEDPTPKQPDSRMLSSADFLHTTGFASVEFRGEGSEHLF